MAAIPGRKSSFASLRNAFKSNKSNQDASPVPPVPVIDHQAYPALRNPFSRSTTSLNQSSTSNGKDKRRPSAKSPSQSRATPPPAPAMSSLNSVFHRARAYSHAKSTSAHSHSSSAAHSELSETGGEGSPISYTRRAPPVPPVPNEYEGNVRKHHAAASGPYEPSPDPIVAKPQKPHEYALHVVFTKFLTSAEQLVQHFLSHSLVRLMLPPAKPSH